MYSTIRSQNDVTCHKCSLALFLDIDGILHSASKSLEFQIRSPKKLEDTRVDLVTGKKLPAEFGLLESGPQKLLADILEKYPHVVLVISSAWRNWEASSFWDASSLSLPSDQTSQTQDLLWLQSILHPTLGKRVVGKTPVLGPASNLYQSSRLQEIRRFMQESATSLNLCDAWVTLDDQAWHFPEDRISPFFSENTATPISAPDRYEIRNELVVLVDGERGFSPTSASALEAAIESASKCFTTAQ